MAVSKVGCTTEPRVKYFYDKLLLTRSDEEDIGDVQVFFTSRQLVPQRAVEVLLAQVDDPGTCFDDLK